MLNVLDKGIISVKSKMYKFFTEEKGEVNIVTIVVLIGIAVALAVIFKGRIEALLGTLFTTIEGKATTAVQ